MSIPGLEHYLGQLWQRWQLRGACPDAEPAVRREGWLLRLCFRARVSAWLIFLLFTGLLTAVLICQAVSPQPRRVFLLETACFSAFSAMGAYYLAFVYWYQVELDEAGLTLSRFLVPTRRILWEDIVAFDFKQGDELLKLRSRDGHVVSLYLALHGLSAIRRCLAAFTPLSTTQTSWATTDQVLMEHVPSWRCHEMDLEDNPFDPLGTWQGKS
jgi:hypothetical protein